MADRPDVTTTERVERELLVAAAAAEVWELIISPGWLAEDVVLDLAPGGDALFRTPDRTGWVEEATPPAEERSGWLVFWWCAEGESASRVELEIAPQANGTSRVRVLEARPLETLELIGVRLPGQPQSRQGPVLLAMA
jgi:hypothetical protein